MARIAKSSHRSEIENAIPPRGRKTGSASAPPLPAESDYEATGLDSMKPFSVQPK
jgi:hypothetical protein